MGAESATWKQNLPLQWWFELTQTVVISSPKQSMDWQYVLSILYILYKEKVIINLKCCASIPYTALFLVSAYLNPLQWWHVYIIQEKFSKTLSPMPCLSFSLSYILIFSFCLKISEFIKFHWNEIYLRILKSCVKENSFFSYWYSF